MKKILLALAMALSLAAIAAPAWADDEVNVVIVGTPILNISHPSEQIVRITIESNVLSPKAVIAIVAQMLDKYGPLASKLGMTITKNSDTTGTIAILEFGVIEWEITY